MKNPSKIKNIYTRTLKTVNIYQETFKNPPNSWMGRDHVPPQKNISLFPMWSIPKLKSLSLSFYLYDRGPMRKLGRNQQWFVDCYRTAKTETKRPLKMYSLWPMQMERIARCSTCTQSIDRQSREGWNHDYSTDAKRHSKSFGELRMVHISTRP